MSEHLDHFGLDRSPFADEAHASVVIGTRALRKVVSRIQATLRDGGVRIGVCGVPGIGKTSLVRALPKLFAGNTRVAAIFDPVADWKTLRLALARDWQLSGEKLARASLLEAARAHRLVLVIDRAEEATEALLHHLDVLQEIKDERGAQAVTVMLFVKSSSEEAAAKPAALEWLEGSRAALLRFDPLTPDAVSDYIERQLQRAGYRGSPLFTPRAALAIHAETAGIPGGIARLCERLLVDAAARRLRTIDEPFVRSRGAASPALADHTGDSAEDAWDDTDHHPRETPSEELVLEHAIASPRLQAAHATALGEDHGADPALEAYLSAPPSQAELRAIRGGLVRRNLWPFAAITGAAVFGGLLLASLLSDEPASVETVADLPAVTDGAAVDPSTGLVLGRPRGSVTVLPASSLDRKTNKRIAAPRAELDPTAHDTFPLRRAGELVDEPDPAPQRAIASRPEELDLDLRDDRPTDLAPPAGLASPWP
jgi:type II secretory pathway predicted ATPase ExeA